jgi:hypothetical protein
MALLYLYFLHMTKPSQSVWRAEIIFIGENLNLLLLVGEQTEHKL